LKEDNYQKRFCQDRVPCVQMLGRRLRALRAAAGRTVASVAADAGLSVPYIANLENGRGNPTLAALDRLARALGTELSVDLGQPGSAPAVGPPASLVRLARTERFRRVAVELAGPDRGASEVATALVDLLARVGPALGVEPDDVDWWRLLDALLLIGLHSNGGTQAPLHDDDRAELKFS
jgi:transcriptional regulator with XRE-family HTH domain